MINYLITYVTVSYAANLIRLLCQPPESIDLEADAQRKALNWIVSPICPASPRPFLHLFLGLGLSHCFSG